MQRAQQQRMMQRARWWHGAGGIALCPSVDQLHATVAPWRPGCIVRGAQPASLRLVAPWGRGLPWLGLPLPSAALAAMLRRTEDAATARWLAQLLLPEPDVLRACEQGCPRNAEHIAGARGMASQAGLPAFLHRSAQVPIADLSWFAEHDVTQPFPGRAWPPAEDHFPAAIHGQRTTRALRGLCYS